MTRVLVSLVGLLAVVLLVGFGVLNAQIGAVVAIVLLIWSGIGWRLVKAFAGGVMMLLAFI